MKENIFIHIPKTGGTTIITAIQNSFWTSEPNFHYRHIVGKTKESNSGDIFEPSNFQKYQDYTILMMVRDPIDRIISEYFYLKERKNFMNLLKKQPADFKEFIRNRQTQNYMVGFLVGRRIYSTKPASENDLIKVMNAIEAIPIYTGIFEFFEESLLYFQKITGMKWNKNIDVKRITFNRPEANSIDDETRNLILEKNQLDKRLYDYCLSRFTAVKKELPKGKIHFIKNKYNHVIPYAIQICLFEFCTEHKFFLKTHIAFFKDLTFYILKQLKVKDGMAFVRIWNATFLNAIKTEFPASPFYNSLLDAFNKSDDPLAQTMNIGKTIDWFLTANKSVSCYFKPFAFNPDIIIIPDDKKTLFSSILNLLKK